MATTDAWTLLNLPNNWDGYGAGPIPERVVTKARVIGASLQEAIGGPLYYVPGADGSIQIECHKDGFSIECSVAENGDG